MINNLSNNIVEHFEPGTFMKFNLDFKVNAKWASTYENVKYHIPVISSLIYSHEIMIYQGMIGVYPTDGVWGPDTENKMPPKEKQYLDKMVSKHESWW